MESFASTERANPKADANLFSKLFLWWLRGLFWKGFWNPLGEKDLFQTLPEDKSEALGNQLEREWLRELEPGQKREPSLFRAIARSYWRLYTMYGLLLLVQMVPLRLFQPLLLANLIQYFEPNSTIEFGDACWCAFLLFITTLVITAIQHHYSLGCFYLGMRLRVACCSVMYRKLLRLSLSAGAETGQLVNLMSNDVNRFDQSPLFSHYLWICPLQVFLILFLLWRIVGVSSLVGVFINLVQTTPVQVVMGQLTSRFRAHIAMRTDERARIMSELLSGIELIKMYVWEKPFGWLVKAARRSEIREVAKVAYLRGFYVSVVLISERSSLFATLVMFVVLGNSLTADKVFSSALFFNILNQSLAVYVPFSISQVLETSVSIKRIQTFLLLDEKTPEVVPLFLTSPKLPGNGYSNRAFVNVTAVPNGEPADRDGRIEIECSSAQWTEEAAPALKHVRVSVDSGELLAVTGTVGAGKSSLLNLVLGEMPIKCGHVRVGGRVSYATQQPWLFSGSIQQNILFGQPYQARRYQDVLKTCSLIQDLELFPHGDKTLVGDRGMTLSGGQRSRVSLARAVYRDADIYLLDDPLSALDAHVARHVFHACILGFLRHKTRVLVTHQVHLLQNLSHILVLNNGEILAQGTYNVISETQEGFLRTLVGEEGDPKNAPSGPVPKSNAVDGEGWSEVKMERLVVSLPTSPKRSQELSKQQTVQTLTGAAVKRTNYGAIDTTPAKTKLKGETSKIGLGNVGTEKGKDQPSEVQEGREVGAVSWKVYGRYFSAGGNACYLALLVILLFVGQVAVSGSDWFVAFWTNEEELSRNATGRFYGEPLLTTRESVAVYSGIVIFSILIIVIRSMVFFHICMRSSRNVHNAMLQRVLHAPMYFFQTNPSGRLLNRFTKDIGAMDEMLPKTMIDAIQYILQTAGTLFLIVAVNWWMWIFIVIVGAIFLVIQAVYLETARALKRLEGTTRSPVFSHLNATLRGLTTVRASRTEEMVRREFDQLQDIHTSAWFMTITTGMAFGFYLNCFCALFTGAVSFSFLAVGQAFGGSVGLAMSQSMSMSNFLQYGIRQSSEVVNQMTSVERILEYCDIEVEPETDVKPPAGWPSEGRIQFRNLSLKYSETGPTVLKNLSFTVEPKEKVGIVGRTGAGKTSLIAALFRLARQEGELLIDNIDTRFIGLEWLRGAISIIPQEPVLFSGTLRSNLDPLHVFTDRQLWDAIEQVELKDAVDSLDYPVTMGGGNLSLGQRQLVCLARAALRATKILVLDEATANVDPQTDALIQSTLRRRFKSCTILTIAHRLETVLDSDRLIVMDEGRLVESDTPSQLMARDGFLQRLMLDANDQSNVSS